MHQSSTSKPVTLGELNAAIRSARAINPLVGVTVDRGRFTVVECEDLPSGSCDVLPLAGPFSAAEAVDYLLNLCF